jgi:hypothetical protein
MIFNNDNESIIAVTTIPTCSSFQWITGSKPDEILWSASIQNKDSIGATPLSHTSEEVWLITKLTIANNTLVYPYVNSKLMNGFNSKIAVGGVADYAAFKSAIEGMTYWEFA